MNAFNTVNIAAACIITSTETARRYGIPESRWIYPLGGAGTRDAYGCTAFLPRKLKHQTNLYRLVWERPNFFSSPSISKSLDAALSVSNLTVDQIGLFDLYSYDIYG
jgi:hypothetical protein